MAENNNADLKIKDDKLDKEVKFSPEQQIKVDSIIKSRLKKQGEKHSESLVSAKSEAIADLAAGFGMNAEDVKAVLKANVNGKKLEAVAEQAAKMGVDPDFLVTVNDLMTENETLKAEKQVITDSAKEREDAKLIIAEQIKAFEEKFQEIDITKLNNDDQFQALYSQMGREVTLIEAYETYVKLAGNAKQREITAQNKKDDRGTGTGGGGGGDYVELTDDQRKLAKDNGMTDKEFYDILITSIHHQK